MKNKINKFIFLSFLVNLFLINPFNNSVLKSSEIKTEKNKIVTLGGTITETVFALGGGNQIIGTDISSIYPSETDKLPKLGYWRRLSPEGVLSLKPNIIIATYDAGPPNVLEQFEKAGIKVVKIPAVFTFNQVKENINLIAKAINKEKEAKTIIAKLDKEYKPLSTKITKLKYSPKTLFLYLRNGKILDAGGNNTPADGMISLAGGTNVAKSLEGFKTVTNEFFLTAQPDVIIVTKTGLESAGGMDALKNIPGLSSTPAIKNNKVLVYDDIEFLGFGPRFTESLSKLFDSYSKIKM